MSELWGLVTYWDRDDGRGVSWYPTKGEAVKTMKDWQSIRPDVHTIHLVKGFFPKYTKAQLEIVAANGRFDPEDTEVKKTWKRSGS